MLTLTKAAAGHLISLLDGANAPENVAARIQTDGGGLALTFDQQRPEDDTIKHEGRTVLVLDEQASTLLAAGTLDVKDTEAGPQLILSGPADPS